MSVNVERGFIDCARVDCHSNQTDRAPAVDGVVDEAVAHVAHVAREHAQAQRAAQARQAAAQRERQQEQPLHVDAGDRKSVV